MLFRLVRHPLGQDGSSLTRFDLGTLILIALLWFGVSAPLSWIGAYFGAKHGVRTVTAIAYIFI